MVLFFSPLRLSWLPLLRRLLFGLAVAVGLQLAAVQFFGEEAQAQGLTTSAKQMYLKDLKSDQVLATKNADSKMYPASLTKLMVVYVVFDLLHEGALTLDSEFNVSTHARYQRGSRMFVEEGSDVSVENLLQGVVVQSGNDATIVLAEGIAGEVEEFAKLMNAYAQELGMKDTNYTNTNGWPHNEAHYTTAQDTAILVEATIANFPEYYAYYRQKRFAYNNITQENRNPLLFRDIGADGLKTGHTDQSGYALAASAVVDDRRIVLVISGLKSKRARAIESERLLRSAATNWTQHSLYDARDAVAQLPVLFGDQRYIAVGAKRDISLALRMEDLQSLKTELEYTSPLTAPVGRDQLVGRLVFSNDQGVIKTYPLYTLTASERVSRLQQAFLSLGYFFSGNMHGL